MNPDLDRQPRRNPWPHPGDTPFQRRTRIAWAYREHLRTANPVVCAALDEAMTSYGETWVCERVLTLPDDQPVTGGEAADLVDVDLDTIRKWRTRGVRGPDGRREYLTPCDHLDRGWPLYLAGEVRRFAAMTRRRRTQRQAA